MEQANADLASLNRVGHRLALIDTGDKLQQVLQVLLPRLLQRIGDNHRSQISTDRQTQQSLYDVLTKIHMKLVEMLSHVMKRVRDDPKVKLNALGILQLLLRRTDMDDQEEPNEGKPSNDKDEKNHPIKEEDRTIDVAPITQARNDVDAFCLNLSLAFLAIAVPRCSSDELQELLPGLVVLLSHFESSVAAAPCSSEVSESPMSSKRKNLQKQWQQISHLLLRTLEGVIIEEEEMMKKRRNFGQGRQNSVAHTTASNKRIKPNDGKKNDDDGNGDGMSPERKTGLDITRRIIADNPLFAGSVFDLILDGLMYETQMGNVPPAGLSTAGWERLKGGHSVQERDWFTEMAPRNRLLTFKTRLLQWIAPSRRFCLFLGTPSASSSLQSVDSVRHGVSRTVTLLVTAAGDPMPGVSEEAQQYLKQHWDGDARRDGRKGYGDAAILSREMLGLCVGGINLQSLMTYDTDPSSDEAGGNTPMLSFPHSDIDFRRRQVAESRSAELLSVAAAALQEVDGDSMYTTGKLAILACDKMLSKLSQALGLSLLRGKAFISAAELLQSLVVRLGKMDTRGDHSEELVGLYARSLALASTVLIPTSCSSAQSASMTSEANVAVRDSIYSTTSIVCRSSFAQERFFLLMSAGRESSVLSTDLLQLLLRSLSNELDKLRQRATATLDALLFACRRAVDSNLKNEEELSRSHSPFEGPNPWGVITPNIDEHDASKTITSELAASILPLMWVAGQRTKPKQSRVVASRWASDLLYPIDPVNATQILCFLSGDLDVTASAIAREGLKLKADSKDVVVVAEFSGLVRVLLPSYPDEARPAFWHFSDKGKTVAVECLLRSYLDDFHDSRKEDLHSFMGALATCIVKSSEAAPNEDLMDTCSLALSTCLATSDAARSMILSSSVSLSVDLIQSLTLTATSSQTRRHLANSFLQVMDDVSSFDKNWDVILLNVFKTSYNILRNHPFKASSEMHGSALLVGTCVRLCREHPDMLKDEEVWSVANDSLTRLAEGIIDKDDTVGNVTADSFSVAARGKFGGSTFDKLRNGWISVLNALTKAMNKFGNGDQSNAPRALTVVEPAGFVCSIITQSTDEEAVQACSECVDALFKMLGSDAFRKDEEIALVVGETLAVFAQSETRPDQLPTQNLPWPEGLDEAFARKALPSIQVMFRLLRVAKTTSNNHMRRACAPALVAVVASAVPPGSNGDLLVCLQGHLEEILDCFLFLLGDPKGNQLSRESCCLGLAACNNLALESELIELNERLLKAFGASTVHGTSAMQETPEQAAQRRQAEGSESSTDVAAPSTSSEEGNVGGAAGVSEASLGAYREMASAAVASGRPDILYSMLILSVSHPIWSSTQKRRDAYGSSTLLGGAINQDDVKTALTPYLSRLLPRILRAMHDPNKETRQQMETLWTGLLGGGEEGRRAITTHFRATMDTLVEDTASKVWRARVGACGALAQIVVGRSWKELGGGGPILDENYDLVLSKTSTDTTLAGIRLLRLWRSTVRALDDVRIPVRESGETLGRSVRSLTLSLCNPELDLSKETSVTAEQKKCGAVAACATALRWLLANGLKQQCPEAAGICISALIGIIDLAQPAIIESLLGDVIYALLMAMSNLEPAAFNYLSVREEQGSANFEALARLRLQASAASPLSVAVRKCVDMLPKMSLKHQQVVVPALDSAVRKSSGIATRSGAAEAVITLSHTCPEMFLDNSSTASLLRLFFDGVFVERGGKAAQDKMVGAFGSLAALSSGQTVRSLAAIATKRYKQSHGLNDDASTRTAAAIVLRSIAVKASFHFADGGNNDIWCRKVLPIAFIGMRDTEKAASGLWKEVWEDGGASVNLHANEDDGNTLEERLLGSLVNECVKALGDLAWSRRVTGAIALEYLAEKEMLAPPTRQLDGTISQSSQRRALKRAQLSSMALRALVELVRKSRLWTGKHHVVVAAVKIARQWVTFAVDSTVSKGFGVSDSHPISYGDLSKPCFDLFHGDSFFENETIEEEPEDESASAETDMDVDESDSPVEACSPDILSTTPPLTIPGFCRLILGEGFPSKAATKAVPDDEVLPHRAAVLQSLLLLEQSIPCVKDLDIRLRQRIFAIVGPPLLSTFRCKETKESPLIIGRCLECFTATFWKPMNFQEIEELDFGGEYENLMDVVSWNADLTKQPAWTIREASCHCAAKVASSACIETFRSRLVLTRLIEIAKVGLKDRKFYKVRLAAIGVLRSIVARAGRIKEKNGFIVESVHDQLLILEAALPHKEAIQELAKMSLSDSEARVTALSTDVLSIVSSWP